MRSLFVVLGIVLGSGVSFGAPVGAKQRYLVATRRPARETHLRLNRDVAVHRFESVNAIAAELTEAEVEQLRGSSEVLFIERDVERFAIGTLRNEREPRATSPWAEGLASSAAASTQEIPYGIAMVGAPSVWNLGRGRTIKVGILDTGIESQHPDLIDDYKGGYDFINNDTDPDDESGHGTHVAGTIGALDNDFGVVGVVPDVEIYSLKVLGGVEGRGSVSTLIRAIDWAIANKLHVINMSLGSNEASLLEEQALQRALDAGVIAVAASGNGYSGAEGLSYPGAYDTVISVGAIDDKREIATFSQRGSALKVVAPGVRVLSTARFSTEVSTAEASYGAILMEGSPRGAASGQFVFCGFGRVNEIPESVRGKIALIERGPKDANPGVTFREKAQNAKNAGATAVVIFNHTPGEWGITPTLLNRDENGNVIADAFVYPLTVAITREDGQRLQQTPDVEISVGVKPGGYVRLQGTSMATPHVSGVVALAWSIAPQSTAVQVRQAILDSGTDLGAEGFDTTFGFGLVNAYNAARVLAPQKFPLPKRSRRTAH